MCNYCKTLKLSIKHQCKGCDPSKFAKWIGKYSRTLFVFVYGLESKIRLCCVIEFTFRDIVLDQLVGKEVTPEGFWFSNDHVPCWYHRRKWIEPEPWR